MVDRIRYRLLGCFITLLLIVAAAAPTGFATAAQIIGGLALCGAALTVLALDSEPAASRCDVEDPGLDRRMKAAE